MFVYSAVLIGLNGIEEGGRGSGCVLEVLRGGRRVKLIFIDLDDEAD